MAVIDDIKEQTAKMKDMTNKEKFDYIWDYYKWWILGTICGILCIISIASSVIKNSRPTYLNVAFINSLMCGDESQATLQDDFVNYADVDMKKNQMTFDYGMVITDDATNQSSYTNQIRLMAEYAGGTIDIVCGPESAIAGTADIGSYGNLEELLPAGMLDKLEAKGYEPFYYTEVIDEESNTTETYIGGIYIDNSRILNEQKPVGVFANLPEDRPILTISVSTKNVDHAVEFIEFITQ